MVQQIGIEVLTAQMCVSVGGLDGENAALDVEHRNIKSPPTKIVDQYVLLLFRFTGPQTVSDGSGCRLVDDAKDLQIRNRTSVLCNSRLVTGWQCIPRKKPSRNEKEEEGAHLCRLSLIVVEVCRDGNDSFLDFLSKLRLSNLFHLVNYQPCTGEPLERAGAIRPSSGSWRRSVVG